LEDELYAVAAAAAGGDKGDVIFVQPDLADPDVADLRLMLVDLEGRHDEEHGEELA